MTDYVMTLASYYSHSFEVIHSILGLPTLSQLIFPAILYIDDVDKELLLTSSTQFDLLFPLQELLREHGLSFSLYGRNGIELYTTIRNTSWANTITPNVLGLRFRSEHLQENIISLAMLKSLFEELVPSFQVDAGSVYDRKAACRLDPIYKSQKNVTMRYFEDSKGKRHLLEVHWINYYGKHILDSLGRERFTELGTYSEKYELHDGIMVVLQNSPYDDDNCEHRQRQALVETELRFSEVQSFS